MQLARVKGTVVSSNKAEKLYGLKLLWSFVSQFIG